MWVPKKVTDSMDDASLSSGDSFTAEESAGVSSRHYFATRHLWVARHSARLCQEREDFLVKTNTVVEDIEHGSLAVTAVLSSVAFLEALVNEVFLDVADTSLGVSTHRTDGIGDEAAELMRERWNDQAPTQDKYQLALSCAGKPKFDEGENPFQGVHKLITLRNMLVHFKPKWHDHNEQHELQKKFRGVFPVNQQPIGEPWYPNKLFGAGCAKWAHTVSTAFTDEWVNRIGLTSDYLADFASFPKP